jgi:hypothetical protein
MSASDWIETERTRSRRPITADEVPGLEALGDELRRLRWTVARLSRPALSVRAEVSVRQIEQIEQAIRRTRRSTLARIAAALVKVKPEMGDANAIVSSLVTLAGPVLAPESIHRDRVEKRRKARWAKRHRHVFYRFVAPMLHAQLDAVLGEERRVERGRERIHDESGL